MGTDKGTVYSGVPNARMLRVLLMALNADKEYIEHVDCLSPDQFPMNVHFNEGCFSHNQSGAWMSDKMPRIDFYEWARENLSKDQLMLEIIQLDLEFKQYVKKVMKAARP